MEITFRFTGRLPNLAGQSSLTVRLAMGTTLRGALLVLGGLVSAGFVHDVVEPFLQGDPLPALLLLTSTPMPHLRVLRLTADISQVSASFKKAWTGTIHSKL